MDMQMKASSVLSPSPSSPSFNNYSSGRLAEIAARVVEEFRQESGSQDDIYDTWPQPKQHQQPVIEEEDNEDDDFEFAFVCREPEASPISADEIFYNGQIRPTYPLFNTNLLNDDQTPNRKNVDSTSTVSKPRPHRLPLRKLMSEERETTSCSSSEADELDGVAPGTYCVWTPKGGSSGTINQESPGRCKKSNSTGSSKRWRLRDLIYRSNSDGKDTFVFLAPSKRDKTSNVDDNKVMEIPGKFKGAEEHCGSNRYMKPGDKKRPFLPYRQDLVGIFSNVNDLSRNLHPF
ncbi:uncharacterized protein LOC111291174 [Durio zibethinus]|uniref:Uncharacterized protein LOC111291174 n=1 Tax=Durio zibethinus TaxID=66656 RepID=A0A6P5YDT9_DURZI|nr:uncharacterized protein LOC111291174 [Durio zibethinus]